MRRILVFLVVLGLLLGVSPLGARGAELNVGGKSAVLMDVQTGTILYERNAREPLAPASVTKVMTMLLIMEAIDGGKIRWEDMVTASEAAAAKGGSQVYLKVGEQMSVADMLKSIAVSSANDCACAMAEHLAGSESAFVESMNERARELGMEDTKFVNCTGLDDAPEAAQHKTSARDIAIMSRELLKNHPKIKEYTTIWMSSVRNGEFGLSNTNKLVRFYDGATGLKTGFTSGAGYCLSASAQREGMELIAVVMGAESSQVRFAACKSMLDYGFANFAVVNPEITEVGTVPVKLGKSAVAVPKLGAAEGLLVDKAQKNAITTQVTLEESVTAPVSQGQRLGTLRLMAGEQTLSEVPLVASETIDRLTWLDVFIKVLRWAAMAKAS